MGCVFSLPRFVDLKRCLQVRAGTRTLDFWTSFMECPRNDRLYIFSATCCKSSHLITSLVSPRASCPSPDIHSNRTMAAAPGELPTSIGWSCQGPSVRRRWWMFCLILGSEAVRKKGSGDGRLKVFARNSLSQFLEEPFVIKRSVHQVVIRQLVRVQYRLHNTVHFLF